MSDNFDRLLKDPPLVGSVFTESLALRPSFPRASLVPAPADSKRHAGEPRSVLHAQAAAIPYSLDLGSVKDRLTFRTHRSDDPPTGAAAREVLFRCLYEKSQLEKSFGEPHEVYRQWAFTPVPAALAVLRVHRSKFDKEAPMFLAVLAYPSVLPFGLSSQLFGQPDNLARFEPGGILPPANGGAYPLLSSFLHDVRRLPLGAESSLQHNLLQSSVITWGSKGFAHVLYPAEDVGLGEVSPDLVPGYMESFAALSERCPISDYRELFEDSSALCIRLPIILPINGASPLPPGILGSTSLGHAGVAAIVREHFCLGGGAEAWLRDPVTKAWLNAVALSPGRFALDAMAYEETRQSLWPSVRSAGSLSFASPLASHSWRGLECLLSFRLLLDIVLYSSLPKHHAKTRTHFLSYLEAAHRDLYTSEGPFGDKPVELAFELLFLRPPSVQSWAKTLGLQSWSLNQAPAYLRSLASEVFDVKALTFFPWKTIKGDPAPPMQSLARQGGFKGPPMMTVFPPNDPRVVEPENDTESEAAERAIIDRIAELMQLLAGNAVSAGERVQLEAERRRRQAELETMRRGLPIEALQDDAQVPGSPVPRANSTRSLTTRSSSSEESQQDAGASQPVDALQWFAIHFPEEQGVLYPPPPSVPDPAPVQAGLVRRPVLPPPRRSNFSGPARKSVPPGVARTRHFDDDDLFGSSDSAESTPDKAGDEPVQGAVVMPQKRPAAFSGQQEPAVPPPLRASHAAAQSSSREDIPATHAGLQGHAERRSLLFSSPQRQPAGHTFSASHSRGEGSVSSTTALRLRSAPMRDHQGKDAVLPTELFPLAWTLREHWNGELPAALPGSIPTPLRANAAANAHKWAIDDSSGVTPDNFKIWSIFLMFCDEQFRGRFASGSRDGYMVHPDEAWFPASLELPFRVRFLAEPKADAIAGFINEYALASVRAASSASFRAHSLPMVSPHLGATLPSSLLEPLRDGKWSCSSYFNHVRPELTRTVSAFSFLTTLSGRRTSDPVIPREGLSLTEVVSVLSNLWWVLSLPAQCAVGPDNVAALQEVVSSTPLLHALYMFITILSRSAVGPSGVDLAKFWEACSGPERCFLAYKALSDADQLLDVFFTFVRPRMPALREAVDNEDPPRSWTLINPALFQVPPFNWLDPREKSKVQSVLQLVAMWETKTSFFWQDVHRRERSFLGRAPECFLAAPPPTEPRFGKGAGGGGGGGAGGGGGGGSDDHRRKGKTNSNTDQVSRASKPILRWKDSVPSDKRSGKDLHELISGKGVLQPHFPCDSLVRNSDKPKICFGFCIEGPKSGCKRKQCKFAHLDGDSNAQKGPEHFGSLTAFLAQPSIAEKIEYTDAGRSLALEE
jgi:hypothetical protein